jgi:hypothetical protein
MKELDGPKMVFSNASSELHSRDYSSTKGLLRQLKKHSRGRIDRTE